jgi:hypothetical protein
MENDMSIYKEKYEKAYSNAMGMMESTSIEPTSALKQAASDEGIPEGKELGKFVKWSFQRMLGTDSYDEFVNEQNNEAHVESKVS